MNPTSMKATPDTVPAGRPTSGSILCLRPSGGRAGSSVIAWSTRRSRANCRAACTHSRFMPMRRERPRRAELSWPRQRRIDEHPVLLGLRFRLVLLVHILDRTLADQRARQDHHPDETRRFVAGLREYWRRAALEPGIAD